jgi:hypothetical protein
MARVRERVRTRPDLDDLPQVHDRDPVGQVPDHRQVVADEQVGDLQPLLQVLEQAEDARLDADVQRRHRLVQDQDLRAERQGPGDADPLPLPAGELVRIPARPGRVQVHGLHQPGHLGQRGPVAHALHDHRLGDDVPHPAARVQRGVRVLEHDLQVPAQCAEFARALMQQVLAAECDLAAGRLDQPQDAPPGGGLAAAGLADQAQHLPGVQVEGHPGHGVHHVPAADRPAAVPDRELLHQVAHGQQRLRAAGRRRGGLADGRAAHDAASSVAAGAAVVSGCAPISSANRQAAWLRPAGWRTGSSSSQRGCR